MESNEGGFEYFAVELDTPEAVQLSEYASIIQDLDFCIKCCERLILNLETNNDDRVLTQSLWTSALISYARCFATGKRTGLNEDIFMKFEGEPIKAHNFYKDLRDKNVAHSVNPFEQVKVGVFLKDSEIDKEIMGIATLSMRYISSSVEGVKQLALLAKTLHLEILKLLKETEERTLNGAKLLDINELYRKPHMRTIAPGPDQAKQPRN